MASIATAPSFSGASTTSRCLRLTDGYDGPSPSGSRCAQSTQVGSICERRLVFSFHHRADTGSTTPPPSMSLSSCDRTYSGWCRLILRGVTAQTMAGQALFTEEVDAEDNDCGCGYGYGSFMSGPRQRKRLSVSTQCVMSASDTTSTSSLGEVTLKDFPILNQEVNGRRIVYLDNAATSQKPRQVIDTVQRYYEDYNSNVHRGIHTLSVRATEAYEEARAKIARFINAKSTSEIIYTRNATEAINLVANTWGLVNLKAGDEVVLSIMEHHSNLVPWQIISERTGAVLKFIGLSASESLDIDELRTVVGNKTKLVALQHVSNALGCVNDAAMIVSIAHKYGAKVLLDGCQSVPHMPVDVQALDCDWFVGSGHKMCGPTGIGFLYGKLEVLKSMPPFLGGGEMIQDVYLDHSTYAEPPNRFEAGTPAIGEAIGLGAACDYLTQIGMKKIHDYEVELSQHLYQEMSKLEGLRIYGPKPTDALGRAALCTFNVAGIHPTDLSMILDQSGFAVRSGHHCAQPLHRHFGINASARASLYFYNTKEEINLFIEGLKEAISFFTSATAI